MKKRIKKLFGNIAKAAIGEIPVIGNMIAAKNTEENDAPRGQLHLERLIYTVIFGALAMWMLVRGVLSFEQIEQFFKMLLP